MSETLELSHKLLDKNEELARENRRLFDKHGIFVINLLSSPGSGKTSSILALIKELVPEYNIAVIEGDIASDVDAQTIKEAGCAAVQINTGGLCHLESKMIQKALKVLDLEKIDILIIENVGNLVCPVDFYLGEDAKCMILSVPEGDDKPLKYPGVFQAASAVVLNKIDVLPVFDFDMELFTSHIDRLNPQAKRFNISATKHEGVDAWAAWVAEGVQQVRLRSQEL